MSFQIESSLKVVVSAALATVLTLIVMTGISGASGQELARQAALGAQSPATLSGHAG
jgi:hypothetical protein